MRWALSRFGCAAGPDGSATDDGLSCRNGVRRPDEIASLRSQ